MDGKPGRQELVRKYEQQLQKVREEVIDYNNKYDLNNLQITHWAMRALKVHKII